MPRRTWWRKPPPSAPALAAHVYAKRVDGLGGRLSALVNAMKLAPLVDAQVRLEWPDDPNPGSNQSVPPADQIFSASFLDQHLVPTGTGRGATLLRGQPRAVEDVRTLVSESAAVATLWQPVWTYVLDESARGPLRAEFDQIEFAPAVAEAIAAADAAPMPPNAVAIHVRAGDIVFGRYRRYLIHLPKAVPYVVAGEVLARLNAAGRPVVLFGQEQGALARLAHGRNAVLASDLLPADVPPAPAAVAEMVLMSRAQEVVAGSSVFAVIAASLAGMAPTPVDAILPADEQGALIDAAHADGEPLADAYAHLWATQKRFDDDPPELLLARIRRARTLDPQNPLSPLMEAALLVRAGDLDSAEQVLTAAAAATYPPDMGTTDSTLGLRMGRWFLHDRLFPEIEQLATAGYPTAAQLWAGLVAQNVHDRRPAPGAERA